MMAITGNLHTEIIIPFTEIGIELGWVAYPVYVVVIAGFVNATNLTDGIDGLASGITAVVSLFLTVMAVWTQQAGMGLVSAALFGAVCAFLIYNHYPAKVFMGDTGSLFLGGIVMGALFQMKEPLLLFLVCAVYIIELLSTVLQILYFKLTHGKRLFKMAPIHHHFEKCGWSENKIVLIFALVQFAFCTLAFILTR